MNYPKPTISPYKGVIIRRVFIPVLLSLSFLLVFMQARAQISDQKTSPQVVSPASLAGSVTGPTSAAGGTTKTYTLSAAGPSPLVVNTSPGGTTSYSWSITPLAAGVINGTGTTVLITWTSSYSGNAIVGCNVISGSSSTAATPLTVSITAASSPFAAGTISTSATAVNYNTTVTFAQTPASGGSGATTYQWQSSPTSTGTFTSIAGATAAAYTTPSLTANVSYRRMDSNNGTNLYTNIVSLSVYPQLLAGTASPASQTITSGATPQSNITVTGISGGAGSSSYTYQWQSSPDGLAADFVNIPVSNASATTVTLSPGPVYSPTYYRLAVTSNGGTAYSSSSIVAISDCYQLNSNPGAATNYIISNTFRMPGVTSSVTDAQIAAMGVCDVNQTIQYVDGLGRPIQTVNVKASPSGRDIVQPVAYDRFGREAIKYLPYVATAATSDGSYKSSAIADQASFYSAPGNSTWNAPGVVTIPTVSGITQASSTTVFEPSPLNRVLEQGAPGSSWQPAADYTNGQDHTDKVIYTFNNSTSFTTDPVNGSQVTLYNATINADHSCTLSANGYYPAGSLYMTINKDENWTGGRVGTIEEYKDMQGHVILKRIYNYIGTSLNIQMLSTYYVYDDLDNLVFVLSPMSGADSVTPSQVMLDNLCYQYQYDSRNRLVEKKIPGKGWQFMVYNTLDQVVMTQDENQREKSPQQWSYTKYDAHGRVIITGYYKMTDPNIAGQSYLALMQANVTAQTVLWEDRKSTGITGYTNSTYPMTSTTLLTANYYDNYTGIPNLPVNYGTPSSYSTMTTGLLVASKVAVLSTPADLLWTTHYYDDLSREVQSYKQHYLGGDAAYSTNNYDSESTQYNFSNQPTITIRNHYTTASTTTAALTVTNTYFYDHEGRKTQSYESINGGTNVLLAQTDYNEIGQVMAKDLHSTDNGSTFLVKTSYNYNERGWLLKSSTINGVSTQLFSEQLQYNSNDLHLTDPTFSPQFNGNISSQRSLNPDPALTAPAAVDYIYRYDALNRLVSGVGNNGDGENAISYDLNGNITGLQRNMGGVLVDNLAYTYNYTDANSNVLYTNQLQSINDQTTSDLGLKHGSFIYTYDGNGNMLKDMSKKMTTTYNMLDLPMNNTITGLGSVLYTYDADGNKLRKVSTIGTGSTTDYISGIQYDATGTGSSTITFIQTEEGRAMPSGAYHYEYYLTDHLGNVRESFDTQTAGVLSVVQRDDYLPFGIDRSIGTSGIINNYLYNKKEWQGGLGLYDYGARFYDPVIGRMTSVDPKAEKFFPLSTYAYVADAPTLLNDPTGMDWTITSNVDDKGITHYHITFDAVVIDKTTDQKGHAEEVAEVLKKQMTSLFNEDKSDNSDGQGGFTVDAQITVRVSADDYDIQSTETVYTIKDANSDDFHAKGDPHNVVAKEIDGKDVSVNEKFVGDIIKNKNKKTLTHEGGHTGGLPHPSDDNSGDTSDAAGTKNFMNAGDDFGQDENPTGPTRSQVETILNLYRAGKLNDRNYDPVNRVTVKHPEDE